MQRKYLVNCTIALGEGTSSEYQLCSVTNGGDPNDDLVQALDLRPHSVHDRHELVCDGVEVLVENIARVLDVSCVFPVDKIHHLQGRSVSGSYWQHWRSAHRGKGVNGLRMD